VHVHVEAPAACTASTFIAAAVPGDAHRTAVTATAAGQIVAALPRICSTSLSSRPYRCAATVA
jgi:hypothetical protein